MTNPASLRARLLVGVIAAVAVAWILVAGAGYLAARHELDELFDAHLAQAAGMLVAQLSDEDAKVEIDQVPQLHRYARRVAFQVWEHGRLRLRSASAPLSPLSTVDLGFGLGGENGQHWRVFSSPGADRGSRIQVAERMEAREEVSREIAVHLLTPLGITLPLLGLALSFAVGRGLRPLYDLARQVSAREPRRLEPIPNGAAPAEVRPLVDQLNTLFGRITASLETERRFTADASHELRTPLAAIRAQAQVAREAVDEFERRHALDALIRGCDRAAQLIEQLLTLARLDCDTQPLADEPCELLPMVRNVLAELGPGAHQKGIALELVACDNPKVGMDPHLLQVLVRNLVDNAVRYSPSKTTVTIRVHADPEGSALDVVDQGPGIPAEERERVLRRFYRLTGFEEGSGLGLSIAVRIAERCGARFTLQGGAGNCGLRATVLFPIV